MGLLTTTDRVRQHYMAINTATKTVKPKPHIDAEKQKDRAGRCDCRLRPYRLAYTIEEAAELVGISRATAYNLIGGGVLVARKVNGATRILHHDLVECLERLPCLPPAQQNLSSDDEALPTTLRPGE